MSAELIVDHYKHARKHYQWVQNQFDVWDNMLRQDPRPGRKAGWEGMYAMREKAARAAYATDPVRFVRDYPIWEWLSREGETAAVEASGPAPDPLVEGSSPAFLSKLWSAVAPARS